MAVTRGRDLGETVGHGEDKPHGAATARQGAARGRAKCGLSSVIVLCLQHRVFLSSQSHLRVSHAVTQSYTALHCVLQTASNSSTGHSGHHCMKPGGSCNCPPLDTRHSHSKCGPQHDVGSVTRSSLPEGGRPPATFPAQLPSRLSPALLILDRRPHRHSRSACFPRFLAGPAFGHSDSLSAHGVVVSRLLLS